MSNDERPESLAAQAAAWVPPWERPRAEPDRTYQAAHRVADDPATEADYPATEADDAATGADDVAADAGGPAAEVGGLAAEADDAAADAGGPGTEASGPAADAGAAAAEAGRPDDDEDRSGAGLSDDDDDFGAAFEGSNPPGYGVPESEEAGGEGEAPAVVDEPRELSGDDEAEATDVRLGGEVPLPQPIEEAAEEGEDEGGAPVDAPLPPDGDDAGDVFDAAADDDVSDDGDVDLPFSEVVPDDGAGEDGAEEGAARDDYADEDGAEEGAARDDYADEDGADEDGARDDYADGEYAGDEDDGDGEAATAGDAAAAADDGAEVRAAFGGDEAADYAAGGAEAGAALGGAVGGHAVEGRSAVEGRAAARPAAADGPGVPSQGRRRRDDLDASGGAGRRTSESAAAADAVSGPMPGLEEDGELAAALEAIMLVVDEPVGEMQLAQILEQPTERVAATLEDLSARYTAAGHGFDLRRVAGGWRLYTRPEYAAYVERFVLDGQSVRLTQAALETLAVVAYKQPVTRSRISAIRGVNCDGVMRTLATRGLIEECGTEGETGAHLYRTTALFLEKLGLNSVDQLPPLAPFLPDDVEEVLDATG